MINKYRHFSQWQVRRYCCDYNNSTHISWQYFFFFYVISCTFLRCVPLDWKWKFLVIIDWIVWSLLKKILFNKWWDCLYKYGTAHLNVQFCFILQLSMLSFLVIIQQITSFCKYIDWKPTCRAQEECQLSVVFST